MVLFHPRVESGSERVKAINLKVIIPVGVPRVVAPASGSLVRAEEKEEGGCQTAIHVLTIKVQKCY